MPNYQTVRLGDVTEITSGGTPSSTNPDYWNNGEINWATLPDLHNKYLYETERKITKLGLKNSSAKLLPINTVIFSSRATIGQVSIAKIETSTNQGSKNFICDSKKIYFEYLFYCLQFNAKRIEKLAIGATYKEINKTALSSVVIALPHILTQQKIASILSTYDDLIENNNKRIKIIEKITQSIYKEWIADKRSDLPVGWTLKSVGDLIDFAINGGWGGESMNDEFSEIGYVIRGTDIPKLKTGNAESVPLRFHKKSNIKSRELVGGDIIIEIAGGSIGQPIGRALYIDETLLNIFAQKAICASFCKLLRFNKNKITPIIPYLHLEDIYKTGEIEKYQTQSTGISNFKFDFFKKDNLIVVPPKEIQIKVESLVLPMIKEVSVLTKKNTILRNTKNLLLPKLISGELDVEDLDIKIRPEIL